MAVVLGLSRWKTPAVLAAEKLGLLEDAPMTEVQSWGLRLEAVIAQAFAEKEDIPVAKPKAFYQDDVVACLRSNLDYETDNEIPVECKTSRFAEGFGPSGTDEVPVEYLCQVQTQIACKKSDYAYLAALIGGSDFRVYKIQRSESVIRTLREEAERFWGDAVVARNIPPHDWTNPNTPDFVRMMNPVGHVKLDMPLGDEVHLQCERVARAAQLKTLVEKVGKAEKARLVELLGDVAEVRFPDGTKMVRKMVNRKGYTVKPTTYEDMRVYWKGEPFGYDLQVIVPGALAALPEHEED